MIKFFRQIRFKLMETGKTSRYLKYAFGEIVLVVIGILIALQINNWNEEQKLQNEINTYLSLKLVNLKEDQIRLRQIRDIRQEKAEKSKFVLDKGIQNVDIVSFSKILYLIVIERYFITTIERDESSVLKYYSGRKEATINQLEQLYINKITQMKLEEDRLNTFSEKAEYNVWINGFMLDNRSIFKSIIDDVEQFQGTDELPQLISNEANGQKALEAVFRRNELANPSLIVKLNELLTINQDLVNEIQNYLE